MSIALMTTSLIVVESSFAFFRLRPRCLFNRRHAIFHRSAALDH